MITQETAQNKLQANVTTPEIIDMSRFVEHGFDDEFIIARVSGTLVKTVPTDKVDPEIQNLPNSPLATVYDHKAIDTISRRLRVNNQKTAYLVDTITDNLGTHEVRKYMSAVYKTLAAYILESADNIRSSRNNTQIEQVVIYTSDGRKGNRAYSWSFRGIMKHEFREWIMALPVDLPNAGMLAYCMGEAIIQKYIDSEIVDDCPTKIVYIGQNQELDSSDLLAVRNFNELSDKYFRQLNSRSFGEDPKLADIYQYSMMFCPIGLFIYSL